MLIINSDTILTSFMHKDPWIKQTDKLIFNNLNIFKYSVMQLISLLFFGSVFGVNRFQLFQKHHRQRSGFHFHNTALEAKLPRKAGILKKVCTAKTCSKCHKVLTSQMVLSTKMQNSCKMLVHNPKCCPYTFTLSNGFWRGLS